jgi:hypothetical protein
VTTSPIPIEYSGLSPFQSDLGNLLHTIAQGFQGSGRRSNGNTTHLFDNVDNSHAARAAAQLRNQIIQNLGST